MAQIQAKGIESTTLSEYKSRIEKVFTDALGNNFNLDPETPQGQIIGSLAYTLSLVDNSIIDMFNATDIYSAIDSQIDTIASNLHLTRKPDIHTQVTCTLTGTPNVTIPAGVLAEDSHGVKFSLKTAVTLGSNGAATGLFVATHPGAIAVPANTLNNITEVTPGWETVNNPAPGIIGQAKESDTQLRARYLDAVAVNSTSQRASLYGRLRQVQNNIAALVVQNDNYEPDTTVTPNIPANSMTCVVHGGADQDIANAIGKVKPIGIPTNGDVVIPFIDPDYSYPEQKPLDIKFYRAVTVPIQIALTITRDPDFPSTGLQDIRSNLLHYVNGSADEPGKQISESVRYSRLYTPINKVPGHKVDSLLIGRIDQEARAQDIVMTLIEMATLAEDSITITSTN